jgi:exo-beta-1,3-glucanase (GH17 family)
MVAHPKLRPRLALALLLLALLGAVTLVVWQARKVPLPDAPAGARVPCLSYAPFRRPGHSPFDPELRVTPAQIEQDLRALAAVSSCVRVYGLDHGLDAVPAIAGRLGLQVWLGVWIGRDPAHNERALAQGLALARAHAGTVTMLVVGNEVLLRRELSAEALAVLLQRARAASAVPVAYADVWEFWRRHGALLRPHVDVVLAHVLPYWEDEPVGAADAVAHVHRITAAMRSEFAPLPVLVGETGWPAAGRQRGPAAPGVAEQAQVVRGLLARPLPAPGAGWPAWNLIEAYDQPWKRALEGTVGGHWGLFDAQGDRRVAFEGPAPGARWPLAAAMAALAGAVLGAALGRSPAAAVAGALTGGLAAWQGAHAAAVARTTFEAGLLLALAAAWLAEALRRIARRAGPWVGRLALLAAAWVLLTLLADGRYRELVWPLMLAPALLALHDAVAGQAERPDPRDALLAWALIAFGLLLPLREGLANAQALGLALTALIWGVSLRVLHRAWRPGPPEGAASTSAAASRAAAPGPAV